MQPSNYQNMPPGELPPPQHDYVPSPSANTLGSHEKLRNQTPERGAVQANISPISPPPQPLSAVPSQGINAQTVPPAAPISNASPHSPHIADDNDLIEKEWVIKAKHIVEQTKTDPFQQTKEINKMKADYLKKRYAKDLKLPEE